MASICNDGSGRRRILVNIGGERKCIRVRCSHTAVKTLRTRIEELEQAKALGHSIEPLTVAWLQSLDDDTYGKLAHAQLVKPRAHCGKTLAQLIDTFFEHLNVKPITKLGYQPTKTSLLKYFGADTAV